MHFKGGWVGSLAFMMNTSLFYKHLQEMEAAVNSLPDEILEIIFSYCTHSDLVQSIQNVCCQWREVAQSTSLWKDVTYCPNPTTRPEQVVEMLEISPKLQNIILRYNYNDRVLQAITDNCAELRKLEISAFPSIDMKFIKNLGEKCPNVEYLIIPYHPMFTELDKCEMVGKFTNLKILHLTEDPVTNSLMIIKPVADYCKKLEHLEIWNCMFKINDLRYILTMRKDTLHTLGVSCCDESGECVLPAVSTCELKSLSLYNYYDCPRHYEKIEYFVRLKTVRALSITEFHSADESNDLKQVFENENMAQLVELSLESSPYFEDSFTELIVRNCPLLKCLSLNYCYKMTDASFKIVTNLKELNYFTISGNELVTDLGILNLQDIKGLKRLRISGCKLGLGNITKLSTLQTLCLENQDLVEFPWDQIPHHMQYLQYLYIDNCRNVDTCAIDKLKTKRPSLRVKVLKYD